MRTFVGIFLPPSIKTELAASVGLAFGGIGLNIIPEENWHVTLKFLGNVDESKKEVLKSALKSAVEGVQPFSLVVKEGLVLPALSAPRIFSLRVQDDSGGLIRLAESCENIFSTVGFPRENRSFKPHMTVARVKPNAAAPTVAQQFCRLASALKPAAFLVDSIALVRSTLNPRGAQYEILYRVNLDHH